MKVVLGIALLALALSVASLAWQAWPEGSEARKEQPARFIPPVEKQFRSFDDPVADFHERKRKRDNDWRLRELEDKIDCVQRQAGNDGFFPRC